MNKVLEIFAILQMKAKSLEKLLLTTTCLLAAKTKNLLLEQSMLKNTLVHVDVDVHCQRLCVTLKAKNLPQNCASAFAKIEKQEGNA